MPELYEMLFLLRFFKGGLTYSDLVDREESCELYEAAKTVMAAWLEAEQVRADEAKRDAKRSR